MTTIPKTERGLWRQVERHLKVPVTPEMREFCRRRGWIKDALEEQGEDDRREALDDIIGTVEDAIAAGLAPAGDPLTPQLGHDPRWRLLADLAAHREAGSNRRNRASYEPLTITPLLSLRPNPVQWLQIRVDARMSLRALVAALRQAWPELSAQRRVLRTRPLGDRSVALLRQICLEDPPGQPWRARREQWNATQPKDRHYKDPRSFAKAFHRAEEELSGYRGLEWYYDPLARLTWPELDERAKAGDKRAADRLLRWIVDGAVSIVTTTAQLSIPPAEAFAGALPGPGSNWASGAPARSGSRAGRRTPRSR